MNNATIQTGSVFRLSPVTEAFGDCLVTSVEGDMVNMLRPYVLINGTASAERFVVRASRLLSPAFVRIR